jgi:hypothetical protein
MPVICLADRQQPAIRYCWDADELLCVLCCAAHTGNVSALAAGQQQLPYAAVRGQTSSLAPQSSMVASGKPTAAPRDHA